MKNHSFFGKRLLYMVVVLLILFSTTIYSFTLNSEDKWGSVSVPSQRGTLSDNIVFENQKFNINLTDISSGDPEDMICVEWNDFENEGGNQFQFEPNACFYVSGLSSAKRSGCSSYISSTYGVSPTYYTNAYSTKIDFSMDTSNPYDVDAVFYSFYCDSNVSKVQDITITDQVFQVISKRRHDCGGSRGLTFDLQGYNFQYDSVWRWFNIYNEDCIGMTSQEKGYVYDDYPFYFSSGDVRCDENEDDKEITNYNSGITAQHSANEHPCTIDEGVRLNYSGTGKCSDIDSDECQTGICNNDNICGSCAIDLSFISTGLKGDTDKNYILQTGNTFQFKPDYTEPNSLEGPDCILYDTDGNNLYDYCTGRNIAGCDDQLDEGPSYCHSGNINDRDDPIEVTKTISTTLNIKAKAIDVSCNQQALYNHNVYWKTVLASYSMSYSEQNHKRQLRQDTDDVYLTIQSPTQDLTKYTCSITCNGNTLTTTYNGNYPSGSNYVCALDTNSFLSSSCSVGDELSTSYKIYVDDDVTYEYPNSTNPFQGIWSNSFYGVFGEGQTGYLPKLNQKWTNNPTFPVNCYFGSNCTSSDNYIDSPVGSYYNNIQSARSPDDINSVKIIYTNLRTGQTYTHIKSSSQIYTGFNIWRWNDSFAFPFDAMGPYQGQINICYDFQRYKGYFYCKSQTYTIQLLPNTFTSTLTVYNSSSQIGTGHLQTKLTSLRFCLNESFVGSNNTNVRAEIDYNGDGKLDYNGTYTSCLTHLFNSTEVGYFNAGATLRSNEGRVDSTSFDYYITGICGDNINDWDENGIDNANATSGWSTKCYGTCYDGILNGNEEQVDYKGRCGYCNNVAFKNDDIEWTLIHDSQYITYPFNETQCMEFQGATSAVVFIVVIVLVILFGGLFLLGSWIVPNLIEFFITGQLKILPIWVRLILGWYLKKKKEKEKTDL